MQDLNKNVQESAQEVASAVKEAAQEVKEAVESDEEKKKKYYSPGEVMKKKGCIGCGGMALAMALLSAALIAALALL